MTDPRQSAAGPRPYHHGDLRRALLDAALATITEEGPASLSLRALARRVGVSHAAPAHHFGDKAGLLTAVAAEGYEQLAADLRAAWEQTNSFLELGVAYVRFAATHRAHFEVMYRPELYHRDEPAVVEARAKTGALLYGTVRRSGADPAGGDALTAGIAAWSLVHGLATLYLNGNLPPELADDPDRLTRTIGSYLFRPRP